MYGRDSTLILFYGNYFQLLFNISLNKDDLANECNNLYFIICECTRIHIL